MTTISVFFQFPYGARVVSSKGRFPVNWRLFFRELLNVEPVDMNVATPSSIKKQYFVIIWQIFLLK
jgi:hypothetical protein